MPVIHAERQHQQTPVISVVSSGGVVEATQAPYWQTIAAVAQTDGLTPAVILNELGLAADDGGVIEQSQQPEQPTQVEPVRGEPVSPSTIFYFDFGQMPAPEQTAAAQAAPNSFDLADAEVYGAQYCVVEPADDLCILTGFCVNGTSVTDVGRSLRHTASEWIQHLYANITPQIDPRPPSCNPFPDIMIWPPLNNFNDTAQALFQNRREAATAEMPATDQYLPEPLLEKRMRILPSSSSGQDSLQPVLVGYLRSNANYTTNANTVVQLFRIDNGDTSGDTVCYRDASGSDALCMYGDLVDHLGLKWRIVLYHKLNGERIFQNNLLHETPLSSDAAGVNMQYYLHMTADITDSGVMVNTPFAEKKEPPPGLLEQLFLPLLKTIDDLWPGDAESLFPSARIMAVASKVADENNLTVGQKRRLLKMTQDEISRRTSRHNAALQARL